MCTIINTITARLPYAWPSRQEALVEPRDEGVDKVLLLDADPARAELNGVEEDEDAEAEAERGVEKVVPEAAAGIRTDKVEYGCQEGGGRREEDQAVYRAGGGGGK